MNLDAVWHDLECGGYSEDLGLWHELVSRTGGPVLDVGAGTGRVTLELAARGVEVVALDVDAPLLAALECRAGELPVETVVADAREFRLDRRFALIVVPMQTVQLLGGAGERKRFLRCAAAHLRPGGRVALAVTEHFDFYDVDLVGLRRLPVPDVCEVVGTVYRSQPTAVRRDGETVVLERRRETLSRDRSRKVEVDQVRLDQMTAAVLEHEAAEAGLTPASRAEIPATVDHVGSVVVMLDA